MELDLCDLQILPVVTVDDTKTVCSAVNIIKRRHQGPILLTHSMLSVTRVAGRFVAPRVEVYVEYSRDGDVSLLSHQIFLLRAAVLLADTRRSALVKVAQSLQLLEPTTLGLVPESVLIDVLSALITAIEAANSTPSSLSSIKTHSVVPAAPSSLMTAPKTTNTVAAAAAASTQPSPYRSIAATTTAPVIITSILDGIGDLQHAGPRALQAAKAKMEMVFEAHRVLPNDPTFIYDKRTNFESSQLTTSDWD